MEGLNKLLPELRYPGTAQVYSGRRGEEKFKQYLIEHGIDFVDWTAKCDSEDFRIHIDDKLLRVQVKHTENESWFVQAGRDHNYREYTEEDVDGIVLITDSHFWAIPIQTFIDRCYPKLSITVNRALKVFPEYKNNLSFYDWKEYNPSTVLTKLLEE